MPRRPEKKPPKIPVASVTLIGTARGFAWRGAPDSTLII
jgi:hypothetical protein